MNLTLSNETITINNKTTQKIYGGFGDNQPCILAKQVAEIHDHEVKRINEVVNNNLDFFDEGIDYINLTNFSKKSSNPLSAEENLEVVSNDHKILEQFYTQKALNRSNNIYLFSQQGYALLCKFLKSETAKQTYKKMVREYFTLKEAKQVNMLSKTGDIAQDANNLLKAAQALRLDKENALYRVNDALAEMYNFDCLKFFAPAVYKADDLDISPDNLKILLINLLLKHSVKIR